MSAIRTYILSVHAPGGRVVLEDVRTRTRAVLADASEIAAQLARWGEGEDRGNGSERKPETRGEAAARGAPANE